MQAKIQNQDVTYLCYFTGRHLLHLQLNLKYIKILSPLSTVELELYKVCIKLIKIKFESHKCPRDKNHNETQEQKYHFSILFFFSV